MIRFLVALAKHADLIGEHALGYAELVRAELSVSLHSWIGRVAAFAAAGLFVLLALLSATVVLTMAANGSNVANWRAWIVVIVSVLLALACVIVALRLRPPPMSQALTEQLQRDLELLREARAAPSESEETAHE